MRDALLRAARANDVAALQTVLPKVPEADVIAALYAAAEAGSADVIAPLVAREPGLYRSYALVIAVLHERDAVIDALLPLRARPTFTYLDRSPIVEAVRRGRVDYLERFASSRDKWNEMHLPPQGDEALEAIEDGYSALLDAIRFDRLEALRAVLPHVDVNQLTWTGRTPLELAEALGRDVIVAVLKEAGATRADPTSFNAFQCATYGLVERLRPFLDDPANRRFFRSYLTLGAQMGHVEVIHEVASRGADEKELSEALGFAAQRGRLPALRALLAYGANANATSSIGYSAVHWAAARGRVDVLRELADAKAKLDKGTKGDRTSPLQLAIERGHVDALRWLLDRGVPPNARASDGSTPLDDARRHAWADVLVPLLEAAGARGDFGKEVAKTLKKKLKKEQRKAFVPTLGPDVGDPRASRYGGQPYLRADAPRPSHEGAPMRLVMQLDLATLPEDAGAGLLQVFQGGGTQVARVIATDAEPVADQGPAWHGRAIVGFSKAKADFPSVAHDPARTDVTLDDDERATLRDLHVGGDKIGGWPDWLQDAVYPAREGRTLDRLLVQIVGGRLVPAEFGDAGHAYVFADPTDPSKVALVTQSY